MAIFFFFILYFHIGGHRNPSRRAQRTIAKEDCKCTSHFSRLFSDKSTLLVQREPATDNPSAALIFCTLYKLSLCCGAGLARAVIKSFNFTIYRRPNKQQAARKFPQTARNDLKGDHRHKSKGLKENTTLSESSDRNSRCPLIRPETALISLSSHQKNSELDCNVVADHNAQILRTQTFSIIHMFGEAVLDCIKTDGYLGHYRDGTRQCTPDESWAKRR